MSRYFNPAYKALEAYTPGEQPKDQRYIKLNTNESPFPPSPGVLKAVCANEAKLLRLYSDPEGTGLKTALATRYGVKPGQVFLSNGSDDILNFAVMAFSSPQIPVLYPTVTYGFYKVFAALHQRKVKEIPLRPDFSVNVEDYQKNEGLILLANPNAPTGMALSLSEIASILDGNPDHVVVIDEAYVDFGGESALPLLEKHPNLLVVQTFSKSRSMAGARLGFAIGSADLIADLERLRYSTNPYNVNRITLLAGEAAVKEDDYYKENCRRIMENRRYITEELGALGFTVLPSLANFVFAKSDRISGEALYLALKRRGILVRHFSNEEITEYNRITVGTREEMEALVAAVKAILEDEYANC